MVEPSRYDVSGDETDILKNKLRITNRKTLKDTETILLSDTYTYFFELLEKDKLCFSLKLIFEIHQYFLGTLYLWAGKVRTVNISKDNILFATTQNIKKTLTEFRVILNKNLPKNKDSKKEIADKLAKIHCEFNIIHPFREGNGRVIRLFLDLIAVDQGYEIISFEKTSQKEYISACIARMQQNYKPMSKVIYRGLIKKK